MFEVSCSVCAYRSYVPQSVINQIKEEYAREIRQKLILVLPKQWHLRALKEI